jgi:uncharacterized protein (TIGR03085 family)
LVSSASASPLSAPPPLATTERASLCDLFDEVGPQAPTLCSGWEAAHLAAHLCLRESNTWDTVKTALAGMSASALENLLRECEYPELVARLRRGPSTLSVFAVPQVDRVAGTLEFFVHHEDVRRASPGWSMRDLSAQAQDEIWSRLRLFARVVMRRAPGGAELHRSDSDDFVKAAKGADTVVVRGLPSELALFAFGRTDVAKVELDGSTTAVSALRGARFGI